MFKNLFKNKIILSICLIVFSIIILIFILFISSDSSLSKKEKKEKEKKFKEFNNSEILFSIDNFIKDNNEFIEYKKNDNKILKKEDDEIIQYIPTEKPDCANYVYKLNNGYIFTCDADKSENYYTENLSSDFYQLNIDKKYLENYKYLQLLTINIENSKKKKKYEFDGVSYITSVSYSEMVIYKEFMDNKYIFYKKIDLKELVAKEKNIRSWYDQVNEIIFITTSFEKYSLAFELQSDLSVKAIYLKQ